MKILFTQNIQSECEFVCVCVYIKMDMNMDEFEAKLMAFVYSPSREHPSQSRPDQLQNSSDTEPISNNITDSGNQTDDNTGKMQTLDSFLPPFQVPELTIPASSDYPKHDENLDISIYDYLDTCDEISQPSIDIEFLQPAINNDTVHSTETPGNRSLTDTQYVPVHQINQNYKTVKEKTLEILNVTW